MNQDQLRAALDLMQVEPPEFYRTAVYLRHLQHCRHFLHQQMAEELGPDAYAFVERALRSSALLDAQARILDRWAGAALSAELERVIHANPSHAEWDYPRYFTETILNDDPARHQENLRQFFQRYPITAAALEASTGNFEKNILEACKRIVRDKADIEALFSDVFPGLALLSLQEIKSSGSDFHKGGKQVLLLKFHATGHGQSATGAIGDFKLVYKPSDLSADCLLIGNSAAVNKIKQGFMRDSLVEIFNRLACDHPSLALHQLPSYRILPQVVTTNPISTASFREAYGYLEYLDNGDGDCLIAETDDADAIIERFYRELGEWAALSCSFSILDLHLQNLICKNHRVHPIDLEVSLIKPASDFKQNELFGPLGGIKGESENISEWHWKLNATFLLLSRHFETHSYQNRLYAQKGQERQLVQVDQNSLISGFEAGMRLLAIGQKERAFDAWFARLDRVLVRYLPYGTIGLDVIRSRIFIDCLHRPEPENQLQASVTEVLQRAIGQRHESEYLTAEHPNFLVLRDRHCGMDYANFDIPAFYHQIGTQDLLDSRGVPVDVPDSITVHDLADASGKTTMEQPLALGRRSFFAAPPTSVNVRQGQLDVLPMAFDARLDLLKTSLIAAL